MSNAVLEFVDDLDKLAKALYTVMKGSLAFHKVDPNVITSLNLKENCIFIFFLVLEGDGGEGRSAK